MPRLQIRFWLVLRVSNKHCLKSVCIRSRYLVTVFWSIFCRIRTEYREIRSISPYSVQMWENTDQKNSEYEHFLCSGRYQCYFTDVILVTFLIPLNKTQAWFCFIYPISEYMFKVRNCLLINRNMYFLSDYHWVCEIFWWWFEDQTGFLSEILPCLVNKNLLKVKNKTVENMWNLFRYDCKCTRITSVTLLW